MAAGPTDKQKEEPIILEYVEKGTTWGSNVTDFVLVPISASEAFRKYSWLKGAPVLNKSGNLRGMVINARMHTVYKVAGKWSNRLAVLAILIEVGKEMSRISKVYKSDADAPEKMSRILMLGGAAILRAVTSVVPTAFSLLAMSAEGYAMLFDLVTGSTAGKKFSARIKDFDKQVTATHARQWDGENWYNFVTATIE